ncbi:hypothetical protein AKO1_010284 [Acrasis kona]|uniref:VPS9 domain-containing protein n=1 Tax=Acrasis kona TaxID=1008807 RepID=A0AAW2ZS32_9EUKA
MQTGSTVLKLLEKAVTLEENGCSGEAYIEYLNVVETMAKELRQLSQLNAHSEVESSVVMLRHCVDRVQHLSKILPQHLPSTQPRQHTIVAQNRKSLPNTQNNTPVQQTTTSPPPRTSTPPLVQPQLHTSNSQKSLRDARKKAEEEALRRMREQMQFKVESDRKNLERSKALAINSRVEREFHNSIKSSSRRFKWEVQDKWSTFIDKYLKYDTDVSQNIIVADKYWLEQLQCSARSGRSIADAIQTHMDCILVDSRHPLNDICIQFVGQFNQSYGSVEDNFEEHIQRARTEIFTFLERLLKVLFGKYWISFSDHDDLSEMLVYNCILKHLFSIGVYARLLSIFKNIYQNENHSLNQKMLEFSGVTCQELGVKKLFRLDLGYQTIVNQLHKYDALFTIEEKLKLITSVIDQISVVVVQHYKDNPDIKGEKLVIGADDMLPIFIFVFIKSNIKDIYAKFKLLEYFMDEEFSKGAEGYAMVTLEMAMNYAMGLNKEDLDPIEVEEKVEEYVVDEKSVIKEHSFAFESTSMGYQKENSFVLDDLMGLSLDDADLDDII